MYSIGKLPEDAVVPPVDALPRGRPTTWQGLPITWSSERDPVPVYLARFPSADPPGGDIFLFGMRHNLADALLEGESLGTGHFVEYVVVRAEMGGGWKAHRLLQRQSVTFSEADEKKDYIQASTLRGRRFVVDEAPRWESEGDAIWPTNNGEPMVFLGQVALPETKLTRAFLTWGMSVYLFQSCDSGGGFKVVAQPRGAQTVEEHYESES